MSLQIETQPFQFNQNISVLGSVSSVALSGTFYGDGSNLTGTGPQTISPTLTSHWDSAYNNAVYTINGVVNQVSALQTTTAPGSNTYTIGLPTTVNITTLNVLSTLNVAGSANFFSTNNLNVSSNIIYFGEGNTGNALDLGLVSHFIGNLNNGTSKYQHTGIVRKAGQNSPGVWTLFSGLTTEPGDTDSGINWTDPYLTVDTLSANVFGNLSGSYVTVGNGNSVQWNTAYTSFNAQSASHTAATTLVDTNSAQWNNAYSTLTGNSASWVTYTKLNTASFVKYTDIQSVSGNWNNVYTLMNTATAGTLSVNGISANNVSVTNLISANNTFSNSVSSQYYYGNNNESVITDGSNKIGRGTGTITLNYVNGIYLNAPTVSASNIIYDATGNSTQWNTAYSLVSGGGNLTNYVTTATLTSYQTTVAAATATLLPISVYQNTSGSFVANTAINTLTGNWNSAYTALTSSSANWNNSYSLLTASSASWNNAYTSLTATSASWNNSYSLLTASSAIWNNAYTTLTGNSASWVTYTKLNTALFVKYTDIQTVSGNWNSSYSLLTASSAIWNNAYTTLTGNSASWITYSALNTASFVKYTDIQAVSSNWNNVYSLMNTATASTLYLNNLSASNVSVTNLISANNTFSNTVSSAYYYGNNNESVLTDGSNTSGRGTGTLSLNYANGIYLNAPLVVAASGTLSAIGNFSGTFSGDGSGLTNVTAANGSTSVNTWVQANTASATFTTSVSAPSISGTHYGDGSKLTNVTAINGSTSVNTWVQTNSSSATFTASVSAPSLSGTHYGDGSKLTGITYGNTAVNTWVQSNSASATFTTSVSAPSVSGTYYGDGSKLTGIVNTGNVAVNTWVQTNSASATFTTSVSAPSVSGTHYGDGLLSNVTVTGNLSSNYVYGNANETVLSDGSNMYGNGNGTLTLNYVNGVYVSSPINYNGQTSNNWNTAYSLVSGGITGGNTWVQANSATATFTTSVSAPSISGTHYGDGSQLTGITGGNSAVNTWVQTNSASATFTTSVSAPALSAGNITGNQIQYASNGVVKVYQYYNSSTNSLDTVFL
jgi:hypothetical protein